MRIKYLDISNFRKLKSTRLSLDDKTTILVGANNSGKTSAMVALRIFLISPTALSLRDITIANWTKIDELGKLWEKDDKTDENPSIINDLFPSLDVWFDVPVGQIRHVAEILPDLDWPGGLLGVRLKYEVKNLVKLKNDYRAQREAAKKINNKNNEKLAEQIIKKENSDGKKLKELVVWPRCLTDFLERKLHTYFALFTYPLDTSKCNERDAQGMIVPQKLPEDVLPFETSPFKKLIKIYEIAAQRDFSDALANDKNDEERGRALRQYKRRLSDQLRSYYDRHLDPFKTPSDEDYDALFTIQTAEENFGNLLKKGLDTPLNELSGLGYPGMNDPQLKIAPELTMTDGLKHKSAVRYEVAVPTAGSITHLELPEDYCGLGYQNLISMVFMLMGFRDEWMRVGKANLTDGGENQTKIEPLQLVLVEEPEAHLHAQVQQVFIRKAYELLRKHDLLGEDDTYCTQLVVSTHSSHVAHEADFSTLRYFRRYAPQNKGETPVTKVVNLSDIFNKKSREARFVARFLKVTHCDLFFADGVIFVEGAAERILVPYFIRHHYEKIFRRYITLLEVGGTYINNFKGLVEALGIATLIITDLDSVKSSLNKNKKPVAVRPLRGEDQKTANPTLKKWYPKKTEIDDLLGQNLLEQCKPSESNSLVYITYQQEIEINFDAQLQGKVIPRTFEDALIYENLANIDNLGSRRRKKILEMKTGASLDEFAEKLFKWIRNIEKANLALDFLMIENGKSLQVPDYIANGLKWFDKVLEKDMTEKTGGAHVAG